MTMSKTPSSSSAHHLGSLTPPPPPPETQDLNNPSESDTHLFPGDSLSDPSMVEDRRCGRRERNRASVAEQERRIEREIIGTICSGNIDSLKPNSGKAIYVGEHYVCVSFHDGVDPRYRTWEWHGYVMTSDENNGYGPEHIYGNYLERVDGAGWDDEEDEERTEDSDIPIVIGNVNLRLNRLD